jgi:hypothetical protein
MSLDQKVTVTVELSDEEAWQLAQFLKRATFTDFRNNAESEEAAYTMIQAAGRVQKSLAEKGYEPR